MKTIALFLIWLMALVIQATNAVAASSFIQIYKGDTTDYEAAIDNNVGTNVYGEARVGGNSVVQTFTIQNIGHVDLTGLALSKSGANATDFALGGLGVTTLARFESTTFTVAFAPSALGNRNAVVTVTGDDAVNSPFQINVAGTGVTLAILQQPADASVCMGFSRSFQVLADGATTYQWQRKVPGSPAFVNIVGATSTSYTTPATTAADDGMLFRVLVSNGTTNRLSQEALLSVMVMNPPTIAYSFNSSNLGGATIYGDASVSNGVLELNHFTYNSYGAFFTPHLATGEALDDFTAAFKVRMIPGDEYADGFSFNWASDLPQSPSFGEEGAGTGLSVCFDTFEGGSDDRHTLILAKWNSTTIATLTTNLAFMPGDTNFADVAIRLHRDGTLDVSYRCASIFTRLPLPGFHSLTNSQFALGARTGGLYSTHTIDDLAIGLSPKVIIDASIPGDPVIGTSTNSVSFTFAPKAIDNNVTTKYLNFDKLNTGMTITPHGKEPVRALTLISAEDVPERDPSSFVLEGSNNGTNFTRIASNAVPAFPARNFIQSFAVSNINVFNQYRVLFPTVSNAVAANSMQIAEVELLYNQEITSTNDILSLALPPNAIDVRGVGMLFDRQLALLRKFELWSLTNGNAVVNITPAAGPTLLKGFELIGAADDFTYPQRRPSSVMVAGSKDGINYTHLATVIPAAPTANLQIQEFATQSNTTTFSRYRITFGPPVSGDVLQVGEMRLFGSVVPVVPEITIYTGDTTDAGAARISGGDYTFPDTTIGEARTATFTIQNVGDTNLSGLTLGITGPGVNNYSVSPLNTNSLAPNASVTFSVSFVPTAEGAHSVSIWITSNDADENPFEINISGTGRTNAALAEASIPGDPVTATSANFPAAQAPAKAIDNNITTKYLNFDKLNTGLTITPLGNRPVRALTLVSAEDAPERDPSSFVLEGSNDGTLFTRIASNAVPAFPTRHFIQSFTFPNTNLFNHYRVRFPTVSNAAAANSMQIAEVELLHDGEITSTNEVVSIMLPAGAVDVRGVGSLFDRQLDGIRKLEVASITNGNTIVDIIPAAGATVLKGFELIGAADDFTLPQRRPSSVVVAGSTDGINYTDLAAVIPAAPISNLQIQEFATPSNSTAFARYRITFGPPVSGDRLQVGEMRLFGEPADLPPSLAIRAGSGNVLVSWAHSPGFVLESKTSLSDATWTSVGIAPVLSSGVNTVTIPAAGSASFFRLRK